MPLNTDFPDYLARQLPDQQSNAQLNHQVSANLLHGMQNRQRQRDQDQQDKQLSQRDRQIDLQERDQVLQEMLAPIQRQSFQNKLKMQSLEIADAMRQEKEMVEARQAASLLSSHVKRSLAGGIAGENATMAQALDILSRYPSAAQYPGVQMALKELQAARVLKNAQRELEEKRDFDAQKFVALEEGRTERAEIAANQRYETAIEVQQLRNLAKTDPATGKVLTEGEFVNRHLNQLMRNEGIGEVEAAQRLKAVYHLENLGGPAPVAPPTPSQAPAPDASNALMDAFKAWIENKKKK